jgi:methylmalonyl-CoA decarboxylase subunit alpha
MLERIAELRERKRRAESGSSESATLAQRRRGKLTVRERLELLFDEGTFVEIEPLRRHRATGFGIEDNRPYTDGVVTGWGLVHGRTVFAYAHDFRIFGGTLGESHAQKIHKIMDLAEKSGAPLVSLNDGAGARIQEGVMALAGYGGIFRRNVRASGVIPQISVILGPCAGGAAYSPALTDFVFMVRGTSQMFLTGPDVVRAVTGEDVGHEALGGADVHAGLSGLASFTYDDERECLAEVRYLLALLPSNSRERPPEFGFQEPVDAPNDRVADLVPANPAQSYDMRALVEEIVDDADLLVVQEEWAPNILCAFARLGGQVVGVVASQPAKLAGTLDIAASQKGARFVQTCDAFNIPIVTLVDVPGFLPGVDQEHQGIIRQGAKLLYAYCNASVPRIQLILRKAYGGAYIVMDSRSIGADLSFAWPTNEIAVMGAEGAANVVFRRQIQGAADPDATRDRLVQEYRRTLMHPYYAAERGLIDDVIEPRWTRRTLISALRTLRDKPPNVPARKHGNGPV